MDTKSKEVSDLAFYGGSVVECEMCGHLHFDTKRRDYFTCPLAAEGCDCEGQ